MMRYEKGKITRRALWGLVILLVTGCAFVFLVHIYSLNVLKDYPKSRLDSYLYPTAKDIVEKRSLLEEGGIVHESDIKTYYRFSTAKSAGPFRDWLYQLTSKNLMVKTKAGLAILKDHELPDLIPNDCERNYCFQHQLSFGQIPSIFWKGLIGVEDRRYIGHKGVDLKSIFRALYADIKAWRIKQGGSTITQQLVKNLFLTNSKTIVRKIKEIILSLYIEANFSKETILTAYFNHISWGGLQGVRIKGIYAASLFYMDKAPENVTAFEGAILIALLKGPYYYSPLKKIERLKKRTKYIYIKLKELGLFSPNDNSSWDDKQWESFSSSLKKRNEKKRDQTFVISQKNKNELLNNFEIFVFEQASKDVLNWAKKKSKEEDLSVKSYMGEVFGAKSFSYYNRFERDLLKGVHLEKHQLGSVLKPILYDLFLKHGKKLDDLVLLEPPVLNLLSGVWSPKEVSKIDDMELTLKDALLRSLNSPVIRLAQEVGFETIEKELLLMIGDLKTPLAQYPAQLLGALEVSVSRLFELYKNFIIKSCHSKNTQVIEVLSNPLQGTVRNRLGPLLKNIHFFGKTGTSNKGHDNWYIFFEGKTLGVIWLGLEGERKGKDLNLYGSSTSFEIFRRYMERRGKRFNILSCD
jgi:penicillin-binding protein 1B